MLVALAGSRSGCSRAAMPHWGPDPGQAPRCGQKSLPCRGSWRHLGPHSGPGSALGRVPHGPAGGSVLTPASLRACRAGPHHRLVRLRGVSPRLPGPGAVWWSPSPLAHRGHETRHMHGSARSQNSGLRQRPGRRALGLLPPQDTPGMEGSPGVRSQLHPPGPARVCASLP